MGRMIALLLTGMAFVMGGPPVEGAVSDEVFERAAQAVAQVRARDCPDGEKSRAGSGFLYGGGNRLVTALHVVAGCRRIDAYFERSGGRTVGARVYRVLAKIDLALLQLDQEMGEPLPSATARPRANDELEVIAFFLGTPSLDNKTLKVTFGSSQLDSMLPAPIQRELAQTGTIDPSLKVVRLDGHLLPGASGAPLITADGQVAAIGSGGLQNGAASISWAVPADHLPTLLASREPPDAIASWRSGLFATPFSERAPNKIRCGRIEFVPIGVRSFLDLSISTDDPSPTYSWWS